MSRAKLTAYQEAMVIAAHDDDGWITTGPGTGWRTSTAKLLARRDVFEHVKDSETEVNGRTVIWSDWRLNTEIFWGRKGAE